MSNWTLTWSRLIEFSHIAMLLSPSSLPEFSGVYRLSYKSSDGSIYVFYVGQADNLKERMQFHLSQRETNMCIKRMLSNYTCYVRYARVDKLEIRDGAEKYLYRHYNPSCNFIEPTGLDITINIDNIT